MASHRLIVLIAALSAGLCAVRAERRLRVVEGTLTGIERAPWLVQIVYAGAGGLSKVNTCAGTIVGTRLVLTSAHCFPAGTLYDKHPEQYMGVLAGATGKVDDKGGRVYNIQSVAKHPKFMDNNKMNQMYDVAVITIAHNFRFGQTVQPIALAAQKVPANSRVVGGGWGVRKSNAPPVAESFAPTLVTAEMSVLSDAYCHRYFARTDLHREAQTGLLCMKPVTGMPCNGDSGSGLWTPASGRARPQLVGVLQGGVVCDVKEGVPFYVDVQNAKIRDFLRRTGVIRV